MVWEKQGGVAAFPLSTKPCLTFDVAQDKVNVTNTEKEVSFSLQKIHKYTLEANDDAVLGLENLTTRQGDLVMDAHTLIFRNYPSLTKVSVYSLDGKLLESKQMDANGQLQLSIQQWPAGVNLVKVGGTTYKIIKK